MKIKRKLSAVILIFTVLILNCSIGVSAFEFTPISGIDENGKGIPLKFYSESVYMMNLDTGETLLNIDGEKARVPASLTKIMPAVVLLDQFKASPEKLKTTYVSCGSEAFDELYGTGASTADIQPNDKVNYYDLLAKRLI